MQIVFEIITIFSVTTLIAIGITAWYCWRKYDNAKDQKNITKYEKKLHHLECLLYLDLLLLLITEMCYASKLFK